MPSPWAVADRILNPPPPSPHATDPVAWAAERLGVHLWSKQREVLTSLVEHRRTAVRSCHDSGKSYLAGVAAAWWIDTHPAGEAFVASTAPTYPQVHAILWEEIRKQHAVGRLPGRVLDSDQWKLDDGRIVGWGRKPADTDEHGFQGIHRRFVLVIIDEACGVPEQLWTAVEAITTNADCRILAIGNPDDPGTEFGRVCRPGSGWHTLKISAFDTPNFTGEPVPPHLPPLLLSPEWVEDKRTRWGEESPRFQAKVLGEFPAIGDDTLIPPRRIEAAQARRLPPGNDVRLSVDVARFGSDRTIAVLTEGAVARVVGDWAHLATTDTTGKIIEAVRARPGITEVRVDGVGIGAGVVDQARGILPIPVLDMQPGQAALDSERFANARAEWWWGLRQRFEAGDIDLDPHDDELAAQLGSIKFKYTPRGQVLIESKDDMRKRGLPSPDRADALMMAYAHIPDGLGRIVEDDLDDDGEYSIGASL